ncbi:hypothetical protein PQX77_009990 [Marasmius sp. AFHP31]|nr:hypothetical protein PQX77_009990 [Marasmius sp. AFHP31]
MVWPLANPPDHIHTFSLNSRSFFKGKMMSSDHTTMTPPAALELRTIQPSIMFAVSAAEPSSTDVEAFDLSGTKGSLDQDCSDKTTPAHYVPVFAMQPSRPKSPTP